MELIDLKPPIKMPQLLVCLFLTGYKLMLNRHAVKIADEEVTIKSRINSCKLKIIQMLPKNISSFSYILSMSYSASIDIINNQ